MSGWSRQALEASDAAAHARRRRANARVLHALLRSVAFYRRPSIAVPFAFPIRVRDAAAVQSRLVERGIYAQRHWARLPSPARRFPDAHRLARELVSLPCDQRYDETHMRAVARAVRAVLA